MENFQILELYWFKEKMFQPVPPVVNITVKSEFVRRISRLKAIRRQATYVYPDIEPLSWNHYCRTKTNNYNIFRVFVCSLRYPECNAHAPYCHLWPVWLYNIFPHYLTNGTIVWKTITEHEMCVWWFSLQIVSVWNICNSRNNGARSYHKCRQTFM